MRPLVMLVHSPLLTPSSWQPVAAGLRRAGFAVAVPDLLAALAGGPPYYPRVFGAAAATVRGADEAATAGGADDAAPVVLIGHSAAGPLLPGIAGAVGPRVSAAVFVDARLPHPGESWTGSLSGERAAHLRDLAQDGWLPAWDSWFPPEVLADLLPDPKVRQRFRAELPRLPGDLLDEDLPPSPPHWGRIAKSYVQLSDAYLATADEAEAQGWPVQRHGADHLAIMTQPALVGRLLLEQLPGSRPSR